MRFVIAVALLVPIAAHAQQRYVPPRDMAYYVANPGIMQETLKACHGNASYSRLPDCQNAEAAATHIMGQQYAAQAKQAGNLYGPEFWSANKIARGGILAQCARRAPEDQSVLIYCNAASQSALQDARAAR